MSIHNNPFNSLQPFNPSYRVQKEGILVNLWFLVYLGLFCVEIYYKGGYHVFQWSNSNKNNFCGENCLYLAVLSVCSKISKLLGYC